MNIQWYPGHMTKAKRALQEQLKRIDIVIEILDARLPFGSQNTDFDRLFSNKKRLFILNKCDLANDSITDKWINYFNKHDIIVKKFSASTGNPGILLSEFQTIGEQFHIKYSQKGFNKTFRAMVVGIPNVGKSAILNRLYGSRKLKEGNKPGVTKSLQWIRITDYFEIMDTPGLLVPKINDEETAAKIALIGSIRDEILDYESLAFYLLKILLKTDPFIITSRYSVELCDDAYDLLCRICQKRGFLLKKGEFDIERGAKTILTEFRNGKLGKISLEVPDEK